MDAMLSRLLVDEAGFIVSAELVLVATILGLGMVVGLAEVASGIDQELEEVATAFDYGNESHQFVGFEGPISESRFSGGVNY